MNPIEHLWDFLVGCMWTYRLPQTVVDLRQAVIDEQHNIPQVDITKLINSMRRRWKSFSIKMAGKHIIGLSLKRACGPLKGTWKLWTFKKEGVQVKCIKVKTTSIKTKIQRS